MLKFATCYVLIAALVLGAVAVAPASAARAKSDTPPPAAVMRDEATLLAVLKSDAPQKDKADACRELARVGTKAAVPVLAALLADEKLSHMARYGLEPIPDPSVDAALREALGKLKGLPLAGVIGSVGVRHDAQATGALAAFLSNEDAVVAHAAARSLGRIGTPEAAQALAAALAKAPAGNQLALCEGLFRAAETLAAGGQKDKALAAYDGLRGLKDAAHQVRAGALRGTVLVKQKDGLPLLMEAVRSADPVLVDAAARTAMELALPEVTAALAAELPKLSGEKQVLFIGVLGNRGDAAALPALVEAAKAGDKAVRLAAIRGVARIGKAAAAADLAKLMSDADTDVAKAAQAALASLAGPEVDASVTAMLGQTDAAVRLIGIALVGQRRMAAALPAILKATEDADAPVRAAAIAALGDLGTEAQVPALLALLMKAKTPPEMQAAEAGLTAICQRMSRPVEGTVVVVKAVYGALPDGPSADVTKKVLEMVKAGATSIEASNANFGDPANNKVKSLSIEYTVDGRPVAKTVVEHGSIPLVARVMKSECADAMFAALPKAEGAAKLSLLKVVATAGGAKGLDAVRDAVKDPAKEVRAAALRMLCDMKSMEVAPDLLAIAKAPASPAEKALCLRAYLGLAAPKSVPVGEKMAICKQAAALVDRDAERRVLLGALANVPTAEALAMVVPFIDAPATKEEACMAAVTIAEKMPKGKAAPATKAAMEKVAGTTANKDLAGRAKGMAQ